MISKASTPWKVLYNIFPPKLSFHNDMEYETIFVAGQCWECPALNDHLSWVLKRGLHHMMAQEILGTRMVHFKVIIHKLASDEEFKGMLHRMRLCIEIPSQYLGSSTPSTTITGITTSSNFAPEYDFALSL